jgi:hypothetical protein
MGRITAKEYTVRIRQATRERVKRVLTSKNPRIKLTELTERKELAKLYKEMSTDERDELKRIFAEENVAIDLNARGELIMETRENNNNKLVPRVIVQQENASPYGRLQVATVSGVVVYLSKVYFDGAVQSYAQQQILTTALSQGMANVDAILTNIAQNTIATMINVVGTVGTTALYTSATVLSLVAVAKGGKHFYQYLHNRRQMNMIRDAVRGINLQANGVQNIVHALNDLNANVRANREEQRAHNVAIQQILQRIVQNDELRHEMMAQLPHVQANNQQVQRVIMQDFGAQYDEPLRAGQDAERALQMLDEMIDR